MPLKPMLLVPLAAALLAPAAAAGPAAALPASIWIDTSACPGLALDGGAEADGTLAVNQRPPTDVFNFSTHFHGTAVDGSGATFDVSYSGTANGEPSPDMLGRGTLVFTGHGRGMIVHDLPLLAFGGLMFDMFSAGSVQCHY